MTKEQEQSIRRAEVQGLGFYDSQTIRMLLKRRHGIIISVREIDKILDRDPTYRNYDKTGK